LEGLSGGHRVQNSSQRLCGCGEGQLVEDLALTVSQASGMDHPPEFLHRDDAAVDAKLTQQGFGRQALFAGGRILRDGLSVAAFQNLVGLQGDLQQADQGFHPAGDFKKTGRTARGVFI
jgi:hypothetical protein